MLTSLDFLQRGKRWPPPQEEKRLLNYRDNRHIFEDKHSEVYKNQMQRIVRVIGNFQDYVSFPVIFNYQKLMSLKMGDLIFGEAPDITANDDAKQAVIDKLLLDTDLINQLYMAAVDVSRYGDSILTLSSQDGKAVIDVQPPALWYPVVDPANIKRIQYHVIAYCYPADDSRKEHRLSVQIYKPDAPDVCETHSYKLHGQPGNFTIGSETKTETVSVGLQSCPIYRVSNVLTSDRIYGIDDYQSIDSIVSELIIRVSQISKILDMHANPSMSGPASALEQDPLTGQMRLRVGDYFTRATAEDPEPKYITWDASLDANFKQIEVLTAQLYTISEMGSAVFGDASAKTGQVASGTALRRLMISPLAKARRIANRFDPMIKRLVSACASIYGMDIAPEEISVAWHDGLPNDDLEDANIMAIRTGNKPTISQYSAILRMDGLSADDTDTELDMIREDASASNPVMLSTLETGDD